jgi:hypothetical protein
VGKGLDCRQQKVKALSKSFGRSLPVSRRLAGEPLIVIDKMPS